MNQGVTYPILNCLCEAEILNVSDGSGTKGAGPILYDVMARYPNGSQGILSKVPMVSMMGGGIGDNFFMRLRGTYDDTSNSPNDKQFLSDGSRRATLGERVLIAFMGGHMTRPIIVGSLQHPNTNWVYKDHEDLKPQAAWNYLGVTMQWDEDGQFQIVRRGAPDVSYTPPSGAGALASAGGELSALGDDDSTLPPDANSLSPQDDTEVVRFALLNTGIFRVCDADGQMIELDHENSIITISNAGLESTKSADTDSPDQVKGDAEWIVWDSSAGSVTVSASSLIELYSSGDRTDFTDGDYSSKVTGDVSWEVDGDWKDKITGDNTRTIDGDLSNDITGDTDFTIGGDYSLDVTGDTDFTVAGDWSSTVTGDVSWDVTGDWNGSTVGDMSWTVTGDGSFDCTGDFSVTAVGDVTIASAGGTAQITLSTGTVSIQAGASELLDLIDQILTAISSMTVPTAVGPSGPPINAAQFAQIQALLEAMMG